jgi:hypothetical protein
MLHKWKITCFASVKVQTPVPPKKMQKFLSHFARTNKQITQHREISHISYIPFQYKKSSILYHHGYMHDDHSTVPEIRGTCVLTFPDLGCSWMCSPPGRAEWPKTLWRVLCWVIWVWVLKWSHGLEQINLAIWEMLFFVQWTWQKQSHIIVIDAANCLTCSI